MTTNKKHYKEELKNIADACNKFGGEYKTSDIAYEVARYTSDCGTIIFYQHRTSGTGNHSLRCRISKMIKPDLADVIIWLQKKSGFNNRFSVKNIGDCWTDKQKRSELIKRSMG